MKNELQLAYPQATLPAAMDEPWHQSPAGEVPTVGSPLKKVHRLLRGRYLLALTLAAICATAGALLGYHSHVPLYVSTGYIEIKPTIPQINSAQPQMLNAYHLFMMTQESLLRSARVIDSAMATREWLNLGRGNSPDERQKFVDSLKISYQRDTPFLRVSFWDPDPSVPPVAVAEVIKAYERQYFNENDKTDFTKLITLWESKQKELDGKIAGINRRIAEAQARIKELAQLLGTDTPEQLVDEKLKQLQALKMRARDAQIELNIAARQVERRREAARQIAEQPDVRQAMLGDPEMQELDSRLKATKLEIDLLLSDGHGENHPSVKRLQSRMAIIEQRMADRLGELQEGPQQDQATAALPSGRLTPYTAADLIDLETRYNELVKAVETEEGLAKEMSTIRMEITDLRTQIQSLEADRQTLEAGRDEAVATIQRLQMQEQLTERMVVRSYGDSPLKPSIDRRRQYAVLGLLGGGALPVIVLLLIGLMDQRYRYSDDAGSERGITLLGILPNLPDLLTDPDQAAVAAHCVHQVRTMLQLNAPEDRRTFAVTSASPGDGKTSLTLALGLSFAASGSRTLLIDCDLAGGGLTSRLNLITPDGVLEAINSRSLMEFVRTTDISDLAVLPVGDARAHHASSLSPAALRRLINEARKHFDTVLVDSGPLMGSIEAPAVCAAVDGVILVVSRGQQRPLVDKAMSHLKAIGAKLAGVVFNRAQARDFDRSVNRLSLARSISRNGNGNGAPRPPAEQTAGRFGPVAKAVATTVRPGANGTSGPTTGN